MIASSAEGGVDLARLLLDLLIIIGAAKIFAEIAENTFIDGRIQASRML